MELKDKTKLKRLRIIRSLNRKEWKERMKRIKAQIHNGQQTQL